MSSGSAVVGLFAVLVGLAGAYTVREYLAQQKPVEVAAAEEPEVKTFRIPIAATDIMAGKTLQLGDIVVMRLTEEQYQSQKLPAGFMNNTDQIMGRITREDLKKGQTFMPTALYAQGTGPTVADRLKPGLRAMTVTVSDAGVVAGFVLPGTTVDVMFRADATEDYPEATVTLIEAAEVLAVDNASYPGSRQAASRRGSENVQVTLAVTGEQANALKIVEKRGEFSLMLRSADDKSVATTKGVHTFADLMGIPKKAKPTTMEVYHGGSRQTITFEDSAVTKDVFSVRPAIPGITAISVRNRQSDQPVAATQK